MIVDAYEWRKETLRGQGRKRRRDRARKRERRRQWRTKRSWSWRNGEREKKGSNSFSFSSLIRLVNRLFWRSRRSHNRATSLFGSAERKRTEHGHHWCSEASLFSSPSPPGCVCLDRPSRLFDMRADIRAKLHLRPSAFAFYPSRCLSLSLVGCSSKARARENVFKMVVVVVPIVVLVVLWTNYLKWYPDVVNLHIFVCDKITLGNEANINR